jgi:hypothetical protein
MSRETTSAEISKWINDFIDETLEESVAVASKIGEDAVAIARSEHIYTTQTGNLQSSCGYAVTFNSSSVTTSDFAPMAGTTDGSEGASQGKAWLQECLSNALGKGVSLILVAGMSYAGYVEDWGGDVLKSAETHVRNEFDKFCKGEI